jgi:rod shape-determining protein MreC
MSRRFSYEKTALPAVLLLSATLLVLDAGLGMLTPVRHAFAPLTEPLVFVADLPRRGFAALDEAFTLRGTLQEDNDRLRQESLLLQRQAQQLVSLRAENLRLRELLNSSALLESSVRVAEIVGVVPDPARAEVVIDKGAGQGVFAGQPVLDASGIMGQVLDAGPGHSRVILITDARHGLPVEISRNGVRTLVQGGGADGTLQVQFLPVNADVRVGDLLVSSGLGGRFPRGYPVGRISAVVRDPGKAFATVTAEPTSQIDRSRHVLLLFEQELQGTLLQNAAAPVVPVAAPAAPAAATEAPPGEAAPVAPEGTP